MTAVIQTENLTKIYGFDRFLAVDNLNLTVESGEIFGFLGPNGAGKTTTLLMLLGLTEPSSGTAEVLGRDPVRNPLEVKSQVGYLPENMGFYQDLTGRENLDFVAQLNGLSKAESKKRIDHVLELVNLTEQANKVVGAYSRGMRQRLGIAELLVKEPKLVFLDEPTLGLDPDGINKILDLIVSLSREQGITVMLSSHMLHQVQRICNRVGIMNRGALVAQGTFEELAAAEGASGDDEFSLERIYMRYFQEA